MTDYLDRTTDYDDPNVASIFDELSFWSSRFGALLFRHLAFVRDIDILDVGCGSGYPLFELAFTHGPTCHLTGIDVWQAALDRAAFKLAVYGLNNVRLLKSEPNRFPLQDQSFDLIVSNLGLNNFDNPAAVLAECYRVARPGARLVLTTNLNGHMREFYAAFQQVLIDMGKIEYLERIDANEKHRGTLETVTEQLQQAGFQMGRAIENKFTMRFLDGSAMLRHALIRFGFIGQWRQLVDPPDERAVFVTLENRLNEIAAQEGELALTIPMLYIEARR